MITRKKLNDWHKAAAALKKFKKEEADLRMAICGELLEGKPAGTHNFTKLGFVIKAVAKINISIDQEQASFMYDELSDEEKACLKIKYELIGKEYKNLEDKERIDSLLTSKPGMPSLSIQMIDESDEDEYDLAL